MSNKTSAKICPSCESDKTQSRRGILSVIGFLMGTVLAVQISNAFPITSTGLSGGMFVVSAMATVLQLVFLIMFFVSIGSVLFGKNQCKACGAKWR